MPDKNTINNFCSYENLHSYLKNNNNLTEEEKTRLREIIDNSEECWKVWNKVRWDEAMNSIGIRELKEYLGDEFVPYYDSSWALASEWNSKLRDTKESVEEFYKHTKNYIYNSIVFDSSGNRKNFHKHFCELKEKFKVTSVMDYGCGVGNDGLRMLGEGVKVNFVDFESPTLDFLKWRLQNRNIPRDKYEVMDVGKAISNPPIFDMFWSIDVIEHMKEPLEIFKYISNSTYLVVYFTDADDKAGGRHPFHFKINNELIETELLKRGYSQLPHDDLHVWFK